MKPVVLQYRVGKKFFFSSFLSTVFFRRGIKKDQFLIKRTIFLVRHITERGGVRVNFKEIVLNNVLFLKFFFSFLHP